MLDAANAWRNGLIVPKDWAILRDSSPVFWTK